VFVVLSWRWAGSTERPRPPHASVRDACDHTEMDMITLHTSADAILLF